MTLCSLKRVAFFGLLIAYVACKHFTECNYHGHLDLRFGCEAVKEEKVLENLLASFAEFTKQNEVPYMLAHGTLLGWYWSKKCLPDDDDIDVQITAKAMLELEKQDKKKFEYNNKIYLLDINPEWKAFPDYDPENVIDARWIDTSNGVFIDITVIHKCIQNEPCELRTRQVTHMYIAEDLYPLVPTKFYGVPVYVPSKTENVLTKEYGQQCINNHTYHGFKYVKTGESRYWDREDLHW